MGRKQVGLLFMRPMKTLTVGQPVRPGVFSRVKELILSVVFDRRPERRSIVVGAGELALGGGKLIVDSSLRGSPTEQRRSATDPLR